MAFRLNPLTVSAEANASITVDFTSTAYTDATGTVEADLPDTITSAR